MDEDGRPAVDAVAADLARNSRVFRGGWNAASDYWSKPVERLRHWTRHQRSRLAWVRKNIAAHYDQAATFTPAFLTDELPLLSALFTDDGRDLTQYPSGY